MRKQYAGLSSRRGHYNLTPMNVELPYCVDRALQGRVSPNISIFFFESLALLWHKEIYGPLLRNWHATQGSWYHTSLQHIGIDRR